MRTTPIGRQAVVIGAGIGGLTAARALADYFENVLLLERDALPSKAVHRAGTAQDRHAHALLGGGQQALCELFPEFEQDLALAGAVPYRAGLDLRLERPGYDPFPQRDLGWVGYTMSRPLIEFTVRRRLERLANVTLREHCRVRRIVATPDGAGVSAVEYETADGARETVSADLVVDASGRAVLTLDLLKSIGRPAPEETTIGVDVGYATAVFAIPDDAPTDWKYVITFPRAPLDSRGAFLFPMEGKRWIVSVGGRNGDKPPGDWEGFLAYVRGLRTPTIYNAVRHAERLGEVVRFGFPANVWRHFERLNLPRGLLPFADGVCRFNPVYGQGMSVAAKEACLLHRLLGKLATEHDPLARLGTDFLAECKPLLEGPWAMAAIPDFVFPETQGQRPADFESSLKFGLGLARLAAEDAAVHKLMIEVQHLLKPRSVYRDPELQRRVQELMATA